jgi:hypothetical protein
VPHVPLEAQSKLGSCSNQAIALTEKLTDPVTALSDQCYDPDNGITEHAAGITVLLSGDTRQS